MAKNANLNQAKDAKKDEFYTQYNDIAEEMKYYTKHFENKVVLCNCDDPESSKFWQYFEAKFHTLKLKKLISTHYEKGKTSYKLEYDGVEITKTDLEGDGDFRSQECIEILKEADILVTNPPFSLFRAYLSQLMEYNKKFIILGNVNSITCKEIFPLIKDNKVWFGPSIHSGDREFRVPDDYPLNAAGYRVDADGNKYIRVKGVRWFTNLDHDIRHKKLILLQDYDITNYPKYDNYDAIEVSKVSVIPSDYDGVMGVPITFIDKYCPEQFEILGASEQCGTGFSNGIWDSKSKIKHPLINNVKCYSRILIKIKKEVIDDGNDN